MIPYFFQNKDKFALTSTKAFLNIFRKIIMVKSACQTPHKQEIEKTKSNFRTRAYKGEDVI